MKLTTNTWRLRVKTTEFLYGDETPPDIPEDIIMRRIEILKEHQDILLAVDPMERETYRLHSVSKAISYWSSINKNKEIE